MLSLKNSRLMDGLGRLMLFIEIFDAILYPILLYSSFVFGFCYFVENLYEGYFVYWSVKYIASFSSICLYAMRYSIKA